MVGNNKKSARVSIIHSDFLTTTVKIYNYLKQEKKQDRKKKKKTKNPTREQEEDAESNSMMFCRCKSVNHT